MKKKVFNTVVILVIVAVSLIGGLIYAGVAEKKRKKSYPVFFEASVASAAIRHEVPKNMVFAVLHARSEGNPSYEKDGKVGLYAMTEEQYLTLAGRVNESRDTRLRWSPEVSIEFCASELSEALGSFTDKSAAFASLYCGREKVQKNITSHDGKFELSDLDEYTRSFVGKVLDALEAYNKLYPEEPADTAVLSSAAPSES